MPRIKKLFKIRFKMKAQKIKALRSRRGYSQEELSEKTGLSLRTIQRIENGETEPRGDSLKRLASILGVSPDEIVDWTIQEDKGFLISLNLSALSFIIFPVLGILVPLLLWISKKDKIRHLNELAKELLFFQTVWTIVLFIGYICSIVSFFAKIEAAGDITPSLLAPIFTFFILFIGGMYILNITLIVLNSIRINNNRTARYFPFWSSHCSALLFLLYNKYNFSLF